MHTVIYPQHLHNGIPSRVELLQLCIICQAICNDSRTVIIKVSPTRLPCLTSSITNSICAQIKVISVQSQQLLTIVVHQWGHCFLLPPKRARWCLINSTKCSYPKDGNEMSRVVCCLTLWSPLVIHALQQMYGSRNFVSDHQRLKFVSW